MKKDILRKLSDENNGYLFTAEVLSHKIQESIRQSEDLRTSYSEI